MRVGEGWSPFVAKGLRLVLGFVTSSDPFHLLFLNFLPRSENCYRNVGECLDHSQVTKQIYHFPSVVPVCQKLIKLLIFS